MTKTYAMSKKWKTICIVLGVLCCLLIVMIPFGIVMFVLASKARITIADEDITIWWLGKRTIRWDEFKELRQGTASVHGLGLVGAVAGAALLSGPLTYELKRPTGHKRGNIAVHWHENAAEIVAEMTRRTGKPIAA